MKATPSREDAAEKMTRNRETIRPWLAKEASCSNVTETQPIIISDREALYNMMVGDLRAKLISLKP